MNPIFDLVLRQETEPSVAVLLSVGQRGQAPHRPTYRNRQVPSVFCCSASSFITTSVLNFAFCLRADNILCPCTVFPQRYLIPRHLLVGLFLAIWATLVSSFDGSPPTACGREHLLDNHYHLAWYFFSVFLLPLLFSSLCPILAASLPLLSLGPLANGYV